MNEEEFMTYKEDYLPKEKDETVADPAVPGSSIDHDTDKVSEKITTTV